MKQIILYKYLGDSGIITSPIYLDGIHSIKQFQLIADAGKLLTKDSITGVKQQIITERELDQWFEVDESLVENKDNINLFLAEENVHPVLDENNDSVIENIGQE